MPKTVWIAGAVGFFVGVFWLGLWSLVPVGVIQLRPDRFASLAMITCPPFLLQFTVLAPLLNAALYAVVALVWVKVNNPRDRRTR
jgi:uncharacterized membrane protein (Fun14 family)